jgi:hypothetical protein
VARLYLFSPILATALFFGACVPGNGQPEAKTTPSEAACVVSQLQPAPDASDPYGLARAGPIWFSAFGRVPPGTPATLASGGEPYDGWKVVIHPDPKAAGIVNVSGFQCSSKKAVRFCYGSCDWNSRLQHSVASLPVNVGSHLDYTGYMVFPGPGLMHLSASDSHGVAGTVVIEVPQASSS